MSIKVLFLCEDNATRSILAEALLNQMGKGEFEATSAGHRPAPIHPLTRFILAENGIEADKLQSKALSDVEGGQFDYVISLSDAADELPEKTVDGRLGQFTWTFSDPAKLPGTDHLRLLAFRRTVLELSMRLSLFMIVTTRRELIAA